MSNFIRTKLMHAHMSGSNNTKITHRTSTEAFRIIDGVMNIGKHKGKKISELPVSYLKWMMKEMDLNPSRIKLIKDILK